MSKKIYVGSLPYSIDNDKLKDLATPYGSVLSATVIMDKFSGRSKGFGFIEVESDQEAEAIIEGLNGKNVEGRNLVVNEARPMAARPSGGRDRRGGGGGGGGRGGYGGGGGGGGGNRW